MGFSLNNADIMVPIPAWDIMILAFSNNSSNSFGDKKSTVFIL